MPRRWTGKIGDRTGVFPFNYVEVVAAASSATAAAPNEEVGHITVTCCRVNICVEFLACVFAFTTCLFKKTHLINLTTMCLKTKIFKKDL